MLLRFKWLIRRMLPRVRNRVTSHWTALVDDASSFEGANYLGKSVQIVASKLGHYSYVNNGSILCMTNVGRFTCIGPECLIGGLGAHPTDRRSTHRMFYCSDRPEWSGFCFDDSFVEKKTAVIGSDVWIGARAIVMDGVTVGHGAVVAAGSIVTKDVEPYMIVGGVPAKVIRSRLPLHVYKRLLSEAWWDMPLADIRRIAGMGYFNEAVYDADTQ